MPDRSWEVGGQGCRILAVPYWLKRKNCDYASTPAMPIQCYLPEVAGQPPRSRADWKARCVKSGTRWPTPVSGTCGSSLKPPGVSSGGGPGAAGRGGLPSCSRRSGGWLSGSARPQRDCSGCAVVVVVGAIVAASA